MKYLVMIKRKENDVTGPYTHSFIQTYFYEKCKIMDFERFVVELANRCRGLFSRYCQERCPFTLKDSKGSCKGCRLSSTPDIEVTSEPNADKDNGYEEYLSFAKEITKLRKRCVCHDVPSHRCSGRCVLSHGYGLGLCGGM